jgi:hypothetical protein
MIRECMRTPIDGELGGEPFTQLVELQGNVEVGEDQRYVQVLRNGGVLADAAALTTSDEDVDWWRGGGPRG